MLAFDSHVFSLSFLVFLHDDVCASVFLKALIFAFLHAILRTLEGGSYQPWKVFDRFHEASAEL